MDQWKKREEEKYKCISACDMNVAGSSPFFRSDRSDVTNVSLSSLYSFAFSKHLFVQLPGDEDQPLLIDGKNRAEIGTNRDVYFNPGGGNKCSAFCD